jgi:hypothetical protein
MRFKSTRESVAKREPTVFAIAESLLAIAFSLAVAIYFQTLNHVAIGACVAPLLLMRSNESQALGRRWFFRLRPKKPIKDDEGNPFVLGWTFLRILVASILVKTSATMRHPIKGFRAIPDNWARVVLCMDFAAPVELVPGAGPVRRTLAKTVYDEDMSLWPMLLWMLIFFSAIAAGGFWAIKKYGSWAWLLIPCRSICIQRARIRARFDDVCHRLSLSVQLAFDRAPVAAADLCCSKDL